MKISGFSMVRNGVKLYYPVVESIKSLLPIVDEFVIAIGKGDKDDDTREKVASINSDKIKIIDTEWNLKKYPDGMEHAHQTDIAKDACEGDWLFYLQADEVVHEKYLPVIEKRCAELVDDPEVEGFLFDYKHFWGDYQHYHIAHGWYPHEIRIIRNDPEIHSWKSAQSFRKIPDFDGVNYRRKKNTYKLKVAPIDAEIYHYGWVRPPHLMQNKTREFSVIHRGEKAKEKFGELNHEFDYGPLDRLAEFNGTHPEVMQDKIEQMDWKDKLQYSGRPDPRREPHRHEKLLTRMITWIEQNLLGGYYIGGSGNYKLLDK